MKQGFKETTTFEERKLESYNIRKKYPERVPVIIEKLKNANIDDMDKKKFLIPSDLNVGQLMWVIRKRIKLQYDKALFLHVSRTIPHSSKSLGELYEEFKEEDGFLYMQYCGESTFGC